MLLRLKNARATYQPLMDRILAKMIGRNVEECVDNILVKSIEVDKHSTDL